MEDLEEEVREEVEVLDIPQEVTDWMANSMYTKILHIKENNRVNFVIEIVCLLYK